MGPAKWSLGQLNTFPREHSIVELLDHPGTEHRVGSQ